MLAARAAPKLLARGLTVGPPTAITTGLKASYIFVHQYASQVSHRRFSSTPRTSIKEYFPPPENYPAIKKSEAWPHPVYTEEQMSQIIIAHRETKNWSDWVALKAVQILRSVTDFATGYRHDREVAAGEKDPRDAKRKRFAMDERKWLVRFLFLESVAGVPGMVGGMLRHLHSLRRMKRDNGWIETLLEEAYNERMHLLTFLKMAEPGWFMKFMVLGAQGVFFNGFFLAYLISPRTCHRFVGYLEEEAVITYTRAINDLDAGKLPRWENLYAPAFAIKYWDMPDGHRKIRDLLLYVRADEAKHREVNHTLGNLTQEDPNPYLAEYRDPNLPRPSKGLETLKPTGWERDEILK
ncbi:MAG: Alternative oxidase, mitochondrial precursor [Geoglossum simile]|nr:MAG: Alternative oxidase, mitochondrial precursor [Geoglossum simile]